MWAGAAKTLGYKSPNRFSAVTESLGLITFLLRFDASCGQQAVSQRPVSMSSIKTQKDKTSNRRERVNRTGSADSPGASVNMDELRELIALLRGNGLAEFELEREGFRVRLRREGATAAPAPFSEIQPAAPVPVAAKPVAQVNPQAAGAALGIPGRKQKLVASEDQDLHYSFANRRYFTVQSPTADSFVKTDRVEPETVVCIIEAMKP